MILTRKRLLMDIFLTRRLSKSLAFCEFASVDFEPWVTIGTLRDHKPLTSMFFLGLHFIRHCRSENSLFTTQNSPAYMG